MNIPEIYVPSPATLLRFAVFLVYAPIGLITYWQLITRLPKTYQRLAFIFFAAHALLIAIALDYDPPNIYEKWLFHPDLEWNIPSILSSTQLAMVGALSLMTAALARAKPRPQRLFWLSFGLFTLFLALDEFFSWKSTIAGLHSSYTALGAAMAIALLILTVITPPRERIWLLCLLTGLALIAIGAVLIDANPRPCDSFGPLRFRGCMRLYKLEEAVEFLGAWLALVAMLGQLSISEPAPPPPPPRHLLLCGLAALWALFITHFSPANAIEVSPPDTAAYAHFESGARLYGYRMNRQGLPASMLLRLPDGPKIGYAIHLVDQVSGDTISSHKDYASREHIVMPKRYGFVPLYRQTLELNIPPDSPSNRALWILLSLWREDNGRFHTLPIIDSDRQRLSGAQIIMSETVLRGGPRQVPSALIAIFDSGFSLAAVDIPQTAQPGQTLAIRFHWSAHKPGREDHSQFLHFVHIESGNFWNYDQQPLGPRLPTRLWYRGLSDSETWRIPLPADIAPGQYAVTTGLYRMSDSQRVPVSDSTNAPFIDARAPLGHMTIE